MHKIKAFTMGIICILLISCFVVFYNVELQSIGITGTSGNQIWVDDDQRYPTQATGEIINPYKTIEDAIEAASNGDTINVLNGTYNAGFTVDKPLKFTTEDANGTIISSGGTDPYVINIAADSISIEGFKIIDTAKTNHRKAVIHIPSGFSDISIINNNFTLSEKAYAIHLDDATGAIIKDNRIDHTWGVHIDGGEGNTIFGNIIKNSSANEGIKISYSNYNVIENNKITQNKYGINTVGASSNIIKGNKIYHNSLNGLYIREGSGNIVQNNSIFSNANYGVDITSSQSKIKENIIENNANMGIYISASNCVVADNKIQNHSLYGLCCADDGSLIFNNTFVNYDGNIESYAKEGGSNTWYNGSVGNFWEDFYGPDRLNSSSLASLSESAYYYTKGGVLDKYPLGRYNTAPTITEPVPAHLQEGVSLKPTLSVDVEDPDPTPYKSRIDVDFYYMLNNQSYFIATTNVASGATASVPFFSTIEGKNAVYTYIGTGYDYICVWYAIAKDKYTQTKSSDYIFSTLEVPIDNEQPFIDVGGAYSGQIGDDIKFDCSNSYDPDGEIIFYRWNFGDGGSATNVIYPTHTYNDAGLYTASLVIIDDEGASQTYSFQVDIEGQKNDRPIANANGPYSAMINTNMTFSSSGTTDPDLVLGDTLTYYWDFGDGKGSSTDPKPQYKYSKANNYTVSLTVTDSEGISDTDTTYALIKSTEDESPGFETIILLAALGIFIFLKRKRKK